MLTVPEAPESPGRSQEHLPWVHGADQSFAASARWPTARTSARQSVAEDPAGKSILRFLGWLQCSVVYDGWLHWVGKKRSADSLQKDLFGPRGGVDPGMAFGNVDG